LRDLLGHDYFRFALIYRFSGFHPRWLDGSKPAGALLQVLEVRRRKSASTPFPFSRVRNPFLRDAYKLPRFIAYGNTFRISYKSFLSRFSTHVFLRRFVSSSIVFYPTTIIAAVFCVDPFLVTLIVTAYVPGVVSFPAIIPVVAFTLNAASCP
jgi:hypothetical protein